MSLVSLSDAQDRVGDQITQDQIDEVEEELASLIGPLTGERTETFFHSRRRYPFRTVDGLYLSRRTSLVTLTNDGSSLTEGTDFRLLNGYVVERIREGAAWGTELVATYEPNDEETVRSVIFDWLTYRQTPAGVQSIRIGAYSETYFPEGTDGHKSGGDPVVNGFLRKILPAAGIGLSSPFRYATDRRDRTLIVGAGS
jgi:hypothetical protein